MTMPLVGPHPKLKPRIKGLPDIGYHPDLDDDETVTDGLDRVTYRLPKLSPREEEEEKDRKIWSRYGYEEPSTPDPRHPGVRGVPMHHGPKFESAMIAPVGYRPPTHMYRPSYKTWDQSLYRRYARVADITPVPVSTPRPSSPANSVKSIHWTLGLQQHQNFDKKGKSRVQGPYSRAFTVTCYAPANWLRMKWGPRSRTVLF